MALAENNELVCYDPNLFLKIYLAGTTSTTSLGEGLWPLRDYFVSRGRKWNVQLAGAGEDWQRARMQVNPHLFDPKIVSGVTLRVIWAPILPNIGSGPYRDSKLEDEFLISKRKIQ
jgi:hypothetical protein